MNVSKRITLLFTISFLYLTTFAVGDKPNIILIMADDLGFETIGCFGNTSYKTPRIDKMAAEGVTFEKKRFVHNGEWKLYDDGSIYNVTKDPKEEAPIKKSELSNDVKSLMLTYKEVLGKMKTRSNSSRISLSVASLFNFETPLGKNYTTKGHKENTEFRRGKKVYKAV